MAPSDERDSGKRQIRADSEVALKWWQLLTVIVTFAAGFGEARMSIANMSRDLEALSESVRAHIELPGHPIEMERVQQLRAEQSAVVDTLRQINERLGRIESNQIRLCQKQGVTCRE
jgi:hypothetical protein